MLENVNPRKPLEPDGQLLLSYQYFFFILPRSLLSHPKEHHCIKEWLECKGHNRWHTHLPVCWCWCISSYISTVLVVVSPDVAAVSSSSHWASFACFLARCSRKMFPKIWLDMSLLCASQNAVPPACEGRSPGLLAMTYVCFKLSLKKSSIKYVW